MSFPYQSIAHVNSPKNEKNAHYWKVFPYKSISVFTLTHPSQSQVKFRLLHERIRNIGEVSADTAPTETDHIKGYYNLKKTIKVQTNPSSEEL